MDIGKVILAILRCLAICEFQPLYKVIKESGIITIANKMCVNKIELNLNITFNADFSVSKEEMDKMQDRSHRYCFVANSLSEEVEIKINI